jgi:hypothetical protein
MKTRLQFNGIVCDCCVYVGSRLLLSYVFEQKCAESQTLSVADTSPPSLGGSSCRASFTTTHPTFLFGSASRGSSCSGSCGTLLPGSGSRASSCLTAPPTLLFGTGGRTSTCRAASRTFLAGSGSHGSSCLTASPTFLVRSSGLACSCRAASGTALGACLAKPCIYTFTNM